MTDVPDAILLLVTLDPLPTAVRFTGIAIMMCGMFLLAREQRVTVAQGLPARPRFIVLWVAMVLGGFGVGILVILAA